MFSNLVVTSIQTEKEKIPKLSAGVADFVSKALL